MQADALPAEPPGKQTNKKAPTRVCLQRKFCQIPAPWAPTLILVKESPSCMTPTCFSSCCFCAGTWRNEFQCESLGSPQLPGSPRCKPAGVQSQTLWGKQGVIFLVGFPGGTSGKEPTSQLRRHKGCGFNLWFGKIPWRSLVGYSPEARRVGHD